MAYNYKNKVSNVKQMNKYMLAKTLSMFEWSGLPATIPRRELERLLQTHGHAFITEIDGKFYAFAGGLGGEADVYGNPTQITIANTALKFNKTLSLADDGVFIRNDDFEMGLLQLFEKQNTLIAENEINMVIWGYNSRAQKVISSPDDKTQASAESYIKKLIDGELSVIGENAFFDGVKVQTGTGANSASITEMIENQQYLKGSLNNEVGISANFNLKRERLVSSEVEQTDAGLFPLVYNMMENRINAAALLNEKYGLTITVDFGSVWADKQKELVDGNPENNEQPNGQTDVPDSEQPNEQEPGAEQVQTGEPETPDVIDGDGERGQSPDTETSPETEVADNEQQPVDETVVVDSEPVEAQPLIVDPESEQSQEEK